MYKRVQTREYKRAFTSMLRRKGIDRMRGNELKTIQEGLDDQGGAFVPADVLMRIIARKPTPTRVAGMCTNITTGRDKVLMPRQAYSADDLYATAFRATWTGDDNRYNIILFCNNLFDTTAYDGAAGGLLQSTLPAGGLPGREIIQSSPFLNAPRTFGVQFQYRWK